MCTWSKSPIFVTKNRQIMYTSIEICAGAGGQALGLEMAGFNHLALVEYEPDYCACLKSNRPEWNVMSFVIPALFAHILNSAII